MVDRDRLISAYDTARRALLGARTSDGYWEGRLASSALSTATAVSALALVVQRQSAREPFDADEDGQLSTLISAGLAYLARSQNADGGWGDTDKSVSNIATTMLVRAAFQLNRSTSCPAGLLDRADRYIEAQGNIAGLRRRYGRDKTFAVPILTNAALAGLVGWHEVSALPFELACFPQSWFRFLRLPVVSYAVPALVAIGQARYVHRPPRNLLVRWWRAAAVAKSLRVLAQMQPASGGFLEATPLTSFVVMSLAGIGQAGHPIAQRGLRFLVGSVRDDGSWPIDTNLSTWLTTLSLNALGDEREPLKRAGAGCLNWLLGCQYQETHAYTGAPPGGWGWSDLSGSVPDADDTPGALLALARLVGGERDGAASTPGGELNERIVEAARRGTVWLLDLQNGDGGWPTFCRGWGKLPFDRSGADLTAHAIRALVAWRNLLDGGNGHQIDANRFTWPLARMTKAIERGFRFLARQQHADGSWVPLWFGNQHHPREENPVYGTARVLLAYQASGRMNDPCARRGEDWLIAQQQADGGWGMSRDQGSTVRDKEDGLPRPSKNHNGIDSPPGHFPDGSSVEETALAVEALAGARPSAEVERALSGGVAWLVEAVETGRWRESSPIGFYFAKLWYYEALYPLIFTAAALGRAVGRLCPRGHEPSSRTPLAAEPGLARAAPAAIA